jgi:hypothetical protein
MQIVPPRYFARSGRNAIVDALAPDLQSWFADTVTEPIPEELVAILRRMNTNAGIARSTAMDTA